jgi:hypothetical protein
VSEACRICETEIHPVERQMDVVFDSKLGPIHKICASNATRILRELGWKP